MRQTLENLPQGEEETPLNFNHAWHNAKKSQTPLPWNQAGETNSNHKINQPQIDFVTNDIKEKHNHQTSTGP